MSFVQALFLVVMALLFTEWGYSSFTLAVDWGPVAIATIGVMGTLSAVVGTYLAVQRQRSGSVQTSEAADLWAVARSLMEDLRKDLMAARERIALLEADRRTDRARISELEDQVRQLQDQLRSEHS